MANKEDNASKPPTLLMSRPRMEQQEEAWRWEKALRIMNNDDDNAWVPLTTTTTTITTMTTLCQSVPFFIGFLSLIRVVITVMMAAVATAVLVAAVVGRGGRVSGSDDVHDSGGGRI